MKQQQCGLCAGVARFIGRLAQHRLRNLPPPTGERYKNHSSSFNGKLPPNHLETKASPYIKTLRK